MDNGLVLLIVVIVAVVGPTIVWLGLRRNLPPEAVAELTAFVLAIKSQLVDILDYDAVAMFAGAIYDTWGDGSKYMTREQFIAYVVRSLHMENDAVAVARNARIG